MKASIHELLVAGQQGLWNGLKILRATDVWHRSEQSCLGLFSLLIEVLGSLDRICDPGMMYRAHVKQCHPLIPLQT